ncbi:uncharacterized protein LOC114961184 isoform X2 [Acropora millepora]|uniref:uncharacterized protein LOC114961184 isoform X2 n=1 Tax=Acropora millepora TaxID=45264 RepID=UPI001CF5D7F6|nr:uncharacterized protein LOC114961184 isoform X2 [Acropora millepora]
MNKVDFAVCRIKEKLPKSQGFATRGCGCVVCHERLSSSWGWKCPYFIVTPSVVLCHNDLASEKSFVAEFSSKDGRGLETFEIKQMSDFCKDVVGRRLDNLKQALYLTFVSVDPLGKRGFFKKMGKRGSLQTYRPLNVMENKTTEEPMESLFCHVITNLFSESTINSPLTTQIYKLEFELETGKFCLQDFSGHKKTFNQEMPPIGAVIFNNKGEFAGLLRNFSDSCVTPVFLPELSLKGNEMVNNVEWSNSGNGLSPESHDELEQSKGNLQQGADSSAGHAVCKEKLPEDKNNGVAASEILSLGQMSNLTSLGGVPGEVKDVSATSVTKDSYLNTTEGTFKTGMMHADVEVTNGLGQVEQIPQRFVTCDETWRIREEGLANPTDHENGNKEEDSSLSGETQESPRLMDEIREILSSDKALDIFDQTIKGSYQTEKDPATDSDLGQRASEATLVVPHMIGSASDVMDKDLEVMKTASSETADASDWAMVASGDNMLVSQREGNLDRVEKTTGNGTETEVLPKEMEVAPSKREVAFDETEVTTDRSKEVPDSTKGSLGKEEDLITGEIEVTDIDAVVKDGDKVHNMVEASPDIIQGGADETKLALDKGQLGTDATDVNPLQTEDIACDIKVMSEQIEKTSVETALAASSKGEALSDRKEAPDQTSEVSYNKEELSVRIDGEADSEMTSRNDETTEEPHEQVEDPAEDRELVVDAKEHSNYCQVMRLDGSLLAATDETENKELYSTHSEKEDLKLAMPGEDNTVIDQERSITDNDVVCSYTDSDLTELVGAKPAETEEKLKQDDELFTAVRKDRNGFTNQPEMDEGVLESQPQVNSFVEPPASPDIVEEGDVTDPESIGKAEIILNKRQNFSSKQKDINDNAVVAINGENPVNSIEEHQEVLQHCSDNVETGEGDTALTQKGNEGIPEDVTTVVEIGKASDPDLLSVQEKMGDSSQEESKMLVDELRTVAPSDASGWHNEHTTKPVDNHEPVNAAVNDYDVQLHDHSTIVLQHVDADALLSETVTNNPYILGDLANCLDIEYQYGKIPCWRDLAKLLAIPADIYKHCNTLSITSPTEDLFSFLSAIKPQLTIAEIKEALEEIGRLDVAQLLETRIKAGVLSEDSVVTSLVERQDTDVLARMALRLDGKMSCNWRDLALQLNVPNRVSCNFDPHQQYDNDNYHSSTMLLKFIPQFDPEFTLDKLKASLSAIGVRDAVPVIENAGYQLFKNVLDDSLLVDQVSELLNKDPPSPNWRDLAAELEIPVKKLKIFEFSEDDSSPTKLLLKRTAKYEPDMTFEELVLALVAMKRQDVLDILYKYFLSDDIDWILEENNLFAAVGDKLDEIQDRVE